MRPRISRKEAAYLVTILKAEQEKLMEERQLLRELGLEATRLKFKLKDWYCSTTQKVAEVEAYQEVKAQLSMLEKRRFKVFQCLQIHNRLIEKFNAIAEGNSKRGDYKHFNCIINDDLTGKSAQSNLVASLKSESAKAKILMLEV